MKVLLTCKDFSAVPENMRKNKPAEENSAGFTDGYAVNMQDEPPMLSAGDFRLN